jgi:uncharacterized protein YegJ (DUF2314 family)
LIFVVIAGDLIKASITDENGTEHLWFKVIKQLRYCKDTYIGECLNTPVIIESVKYGGWAKFKFEDIMDNRKV